MHLKPISPNKVELIPKDNKFPFFLSQVESGSILMIEKVITNGEMEAEAEANLSLPEEWHGPWTKRESLLPCTCPAMENCDSKAVSHGRESWCGLPETQAALSLDLVTQVARRENQL